METTVIEMKSLLIKDIKKHGICPGIVKLTKGFLSRKGLNKEEQEYFLRSAFFKAVGIRCVTEC